MFFVVERRWLSGRSAVWAVFAMKVAHVCGLRRFISSVVWGYSSMSRGMWRIIELSSEINVSVPVTPGII